MPGVIAPINDRSEPKTKSKKINKINQHHGTSFRPRTFISFQVKSTFVILGLGTGRGRGWVGLGSSDCVRQSSLIYPVGTRSTNNNRATLREGKEKKKEKTASQNAT